MKFIKQASTKFIKFIRDDHECNILFKLHFMAVEVESFDISRMS